MLHIGITSCTFPPWTELFKKNDYEKNDYEKNDYEKNDYEKNDYEKNDYEKNDYDYIRDTVPKAYVYGSF